MVDNTEYLLRQILETLKDIKSELETIKGYERNDSNNIDFIKSKVKDIEGKIKR